MMKQAIHLFFFALLVSTSFAVDLQGGGFGCSFYCKNILGLCEMECDLMCNKVEPEAGFRKWYYYEVKYLFDKFATVTDFEEEYEEAFVKTVQDISGQSDSTFRIKMNKKWVDVSKYQEEEGAVNELLGLSYIQFFENKDIGKDVYGKVKSSFDVKFLFHEKFMQNYANINENKMPPYFNFHLMEISEVKNAKKGEFIELAPTATPTFGGTEPTVSPTMEPSFSPEYLYIDDVFNPKERPPTATKEDGDDVDGVGDVNDGDDGDKTNPLQGYDTDDTDSSDYNKRIPGDSVLHDNEYANQTSNVPFFAIGGILAACIVFFVYKLKNNKAEASTTDVTDDNKVPLLEENENGNGNEKDNINNA